MGGHVVLEIPAVMNNSLSPMCSISLSLNVCLCFADYRVRLSSSERFSISAVFPNYQSKNVSKGKKKKGKQLTIRFQKP